MPGNCTSQIKVYVSVIDWCMVLDDLRIAITDIVAIQIESHLEIVDEGCGCRGAKIASPKTIHIEIRKGTPNAVKCCGWDLSTVLRLEYCDNADEFVEAIMTTMIRD